MDIPVTTQTLSNVSSDALLIGAARKTTSQGKKDVLLSTAASTIDEVLHGLIQQRCTDGEFKGNLGEIMTIHPAGRLAVKRVIVVGLGAQGTITTQSLRRASAILYAISKIQGHTMSLWRYSRKAHILTIAWECKLR